MNKTKRILMVAAENDALPGAKVGGVGDVLRDLPKALIREGGGVDTVIPSYGFLARLEGLENLGSVNVKFAGHLHDVDILRLQGGGTDADHYILHCEEFSKKGESVYFDDGHGRPFASDASKFAFFSSCVAQALLWGLIPKPDVLHCHDWHTAFLLILIRFGFEFVSLKDIRTVFTIHNLAMQGIRPYEGDESSFNEWFPDLRYSLDKLSDPRYPDCVNPMRAGILLADRVHTVSPSYAEEILKPSRPELGIYGGDGLENDLKERTDRGEVSGILNGCEYPDNLDTTPLSKSKLVKLILRSVELWASRSKLMPSTHWLAGKSVAVWQAKRVSGVTITSVGRLTEQKARILSTPMKNGKSGLQGILDILGKSGTMIILGSGNPELETFISQASAENDNLIFLNGYSDELSKALYNYGDLFLMPSSFEPCGISQMLAMRAGQPCLVNSVGGLKDTVNHMETGFVFAGDTVEQQAEAMVKLFEEVLSLFKNDKKAIEDISTAALAKRFTWVDSADHFLEELY